MPVHANTQIAYIAKTEDLRSILMVLTLETGASTVLAEADDWAIDLAWSPTGDLIAFSVGNRVMRVNPDGTDLRPVTAQRNRDPAWLRWSSDGAHLLYGAEVRDRGPCLLVITLATGEAAFPRCSPTLNGGYDWSPDGAQIVFTERDVRSTSTIHVMDADGSNLFTLTNNRGDDIRPHWSPDGRWIVFSSNRADETYRPYYVAAEGGRVRSATHLAGARCCAGWR